MEERELTLLIYFASDNPLAPLVVSELKAIKDAGFQENTTVLCLYDPMEKDAPTQLLDVNFKRRKAKGTFIGDGADPYVRNMTEDEVDPAEFTKAMHATLDPAATVTAFESLKSFIEFGLKKRTAKNYMLILLGHGMIVGNDTFLPDGDTDSAITLKELKKLCEMFTTDNETSLRLLGLHSCSMSSIEVAYELKGKADYMLATQGTMFVNGWPYRQLLKKTLNQVKHTQNKGRDATLNYCELIEKLYYLCLYNFTDFMTAGYSCDIALCRLHPDNFEKLKAPMQELVSALKKGLPPPPEPSIIKDLILLAHWDAQSFWSENYTDLWDFCDCLARRCEATNPGHEIIGLCQRVKDALARGKQRGNPEHIVRLADNFGTEYQYARGLSIYFPWHQPFEVQEPTSKQDSNKQTETKPPRKTILQNYREYDFTIEFGDHSWFSFLAAYWKGTKRDPRDESKEPFRVDRDPREPVPDDVHKKVKDSFEKRIKRTPELKKTPDVGTDCTCPTIKNYPTTRVEDTDTNLPEFSITPGALGAFLPPKEPEEQ
ncbi:MAG TPA: clostripain-related cysteine peptidase [Pyrinomonadaceae bacterium]|nr:clostripain-related cysteine peptidase [Pyrinomonadaceae bacterium]